MDALVTLAANTAAIVASGCILHIVSYLARVLFSQQDTTLLLCGCLAKLASHVELCGAIIATGGAAVLFSAATHATQDRLCQVIACRALEKLLLVADGDTKTAISAALESALPAALGAAAAV